MKCKKCGHEILNENVKICPSCGAKIKGDKFPAWALVLIILFAASVLVVPVIIGVVAAFTLPVLMSSTDSAQSKSLFKKEIAFLNQSLQLSYAMNDKYYTDTDEVWEKAVKKNLNVVSDSGNVVKLSDLSEIKYEKINDNCSASFDNAGEQSACAALIIDTDGFDKGHNKFADEKSVNDRFRILLYSNKAVPAPDSIEYKILYNTNKK